jgi:hypothetical protein
VSQLKVHFHSLQATRFKIVIKKKNFPETLLQLCLIAFQKPRGLYIGKYPPPPGKEKISADVIWGKNMKRQREKREKGGKCKRKRKKRERKRKKGERK